MFSISLSEVLIVLIVMVMVYKKEDYSQIMKTIKSIKKQIASFRKSAFDFIDEVTGENDFVTKIKGDDGKEYIAYNLDLIKPDIKENEPEKPQNIAAHSGDKI
ncbi:MAG: hypothetical protein J0G32_05945 [Alphaproteobacteria bacterium]|nr:hypothetical protein [Alphaproteobacteria bacterium]OJV15762.1 MAG: hypothetical protein BGO27_07595 [Alphaproteobacteria bacterium 33-17]